MFAYSIFGYFLRSDSSGRRFIFVGVVYVCAVRTDLLVSITVQLRKQFNQNDGAETESDA